MSAPDRSEVAASTYLEQQVRGESPLRLIARVFEMATLEVSKARTAMAQRDWAAKGNAVNRASRAISLLQCSLDMDKGGEVAVNLDRVYGYLLRRLGEAHLNNDEVGFDEVLRHLRELGSAWQEVSRRPHPESAGASSTSTKPVPQPALGG